MISNCIIQNGFNPTNGNLLSNNIFLYTATSFYFYGDNNILNNNIFLNQLISAGTGNVYKFNINFFTYKTMI